MDKNNQDTKASFESNPKIQFYATATVISVVDGDTFHIQYKNEATKDIVRLLAVNTLEKNSSIPREKCLANLATDFTSKNLLNQEIVLYRDTTQPRRDKYDRLLAYARLSMANHFYNQDLMHSGLANTYKATPPAVEWSKYESIRQQKEQASEGIWNKELCTGFTP